MKTIVLFRHIIILLVASFVALFELHAQQKRMLIVTGGKDFDKAAFYEMFNGIEHDTISKPVAFARFGEAGFNSRYAAVVFFDTYQSISQPEEEAFLGLFKAGVGCVFLHHALVSHQEWDEYEKIVGGKYHHKPYIHGEKKYGPSTYKHDQDFTVKILNRNHPVTGGVQDFSIHDETYLNISVRNDVTPLLTSYNCESGEYIGWAHKYVNSKVVYLQPGHDRFAFENPSYRLLVRNAIDWVSR